MLSEQFPHHISEPILIVVEVCDNIGVGFHFVLAFFMAIPQPAASSMEMSFSASPAAKESETGMPR